MKPLSDRKRKVIINIANLIGYKVTFANEYSPEFSDRLVIKVWKKT